MKQALAIVLIFSITLTATPINIQAETIPPPTGTAMSAQGDEWYVMFTQDELENLLAPIALYPDPLLAQVLLAATFPDQIDEAARVLRAYGTNYNVDGTDWDVSVKAVAHYPTVLSMMADKIDWTTSVGQAYVSQSTDVMEAVQRLRARARSLGNLYTTPQQEIVETGGYIYIYPAQPRYIYVPTYDPAIIYVHRTRDWVGPLIFFSVALIIGAWLNHDCDWPHHRVYYHGWDRGPVWINRARPYVRITNVYVNNDYRDVRFNRDVTRRQVNYGSLNRYKSVHPDVDYSRVRRERGAPGERREAARPPQPPQPQPQAPQPPRDNKIIRRNIDPNDPRIESNRGRTRPDAGRQQVSRPEAPQLPQPQRQPQVPQPRQPVTPQPQPRQPQAPRQPETRAPQAPSIPQQPGRVQAPRPTEQVFRGSPGPIDSRSASQRGQASRQAERQRAPEVRQAPKQQAPGAPKGQPSKQGQGRRK